MTRKPGKVENKSLEKQFKGIKDYGAMMDAEAEVKRYQELFQIAQKHDTPRGTDRKSTKVEHCVKNYGADEAGESKDKSRENKEYSEVVTTFGKKTQIRKLP